MLHTSDGDLVEHAPVAYQMIDGVQHPSPAGSSSAAMARWASRSGVMTTAARW